VFFGPSAVRSKLYLQSFLSAQVRYIHGMPHRTLTVEEVTEYLHLTPSDVERLVRESDIPYSMRGGRMVFQRSELDAWASKRILGLPEKRLDVYHEKSVRGTRHVFPGGGLIPELLRPEYIDLALPSKTRASVIRDMVALADRTGRVLDPRELVESVQAREDLCSTAMEGGFALLHARHHLEYRFEGSFLVIGRTIQSVPFGAPDGRATRVFFLICCEDDRIHLHALARLALLAMKTDMVQQLFAAESASAAYDALVHAEQTAMGSAAPGG
jgi:nitrogen PTS system EIIA component